MQFTTADVDCVYGCALSAIDAYAAFMTACREYVKGSWEAKEDPWHCPERSVLKRFGRARAEACNELRRLDRLLSKYQSLLDDTSEGAVEIDGKPGGSMPEAVAAVLRDAVPLEGENFAKPSATTGIWLSYRDRYPGVSVERVRIDLRLERSRVRAAVDARGTREPKQDLGVRPQGYAMHDAPAEVDEDDGLPEGPLRRLRGVPRRMLAHLWQRQGRLVTYQDLADRVWGDDEASDQTIHKAKRTLVKDLISVDAEDVAKRIESVRGKGYVLT